MPKYRIKISHIYGYKGKGFLIDGRWVNRGFTVCDSHGFINLIPGAGWFETIKDAFLGVQALEEAEATGVNFHKIYRRLLAETYPDREDVTERILKDLAKRHNMTITSVVDYGNGDKEVRVIH